MIVTEYMSHGALDDFLRVSGLGPGGADSPSCDSWEGLGNGVLPPARLADYTAVRRRLSPSPEPPSSPSPCSSTRGSWRLGSFWGCYPGWHPP